VQHFLGGLLVAHVPGVVRGGEYILDRGLVPSCDRLEPEAFNVEREMVHQADAASGRRKNLPPKVVGCKTLDGRKNVLALPVQRAQQHPLFGRWVRWHD
jgi:hypothetical protein